ncbi:MAG TPA: carbon monoxide dehydrogenase subunit G [Thermoanaerobaculia bacterium]|nr:carbon monoxide dehydrogenase subunit G [Thermoanaerobaculia bacterium]
MKIQGEHTFEAPRELVWRALLDPDVLTRVLPGTEKLERVGDDSFRGVMNVQVGPVKGQFQGTLQLTDLVAQESYHMKLNGSGPSGFMTGEGQISLADAATGTTLRYDLDAQVGGRVAGVGQRVLESSARAITKQGLEGLGRELQAMKAAEAAPAPVIATAEPAAAAGASALAAPAAAPVVPITPVAPAIAPVHPTQTEFAARVAADVTRDLVPPAKRPWLIGGALLVVIALGLLIARACGS